MMRGAGEEFAMWLIFTGLLILLSLTDIRKRILPNRLLLLAALNRVLWMFLLREPVIPTLQAVLPGLAVPFALLLFVFAYENFRGREAMGAGDIKLLFVMALYLDGERLLLALLAGCLFGLLGASLAYFAGRRGGAAIPFGPFLSVGCVFAAAFGRPIIGWYTGGM